jgi:hypothetical protein
MFDNCRLIVCGVVLEVCEVIANVAVAGGAAL